MRYFDRDWGEFFEFAKHWDRCSVLTQQVLSSMKPTGGVPCEDFGSDLFWLLTEHVVELYRERTRVRQHPDRRSCFTLLRAIMRVPLEADADSVGALHYLKEHFVGDERDALLPEDGRVIASVQWERLAGLVTSRDHVEGFLGAECLEEWERCRIPRAELWSQANACTEALLANEQVAEDCRRLVHALSLDEQPRTFCELREIFEEVSTERLGLAIHAALRYALIFPCLHPADDALCLTLWPDVVKAMNREELKLPAALDPSELVRTFDVAWGLDDVTQLLVAAAEPIRLRSSDKDLFAKAKRELEGSLQPHAELPILFDRVGLTIEERLRMARRTAEECEWLETRGTTGKNLVLALTDAGRDWLGRSAAERLRAMMDHVCLDLEADEKIARAPYLNSDYCEGYFPDSSFTRSDAKLLKVIPAARAALSALDGAPLPLEAFLEALNAAGLPESLRKHWGRRELAWYFGHMYEAQREFIWFWSICELLGFRLFRYGGLSFGWTESGLVTVQLTDVGRYYLGLTDEFEYGADAADRPVLVQPDFEVIFLAPSAQHEAAISRFAERTGTHLGALFRITRASIHAAARAGLEAKSVLDELASATSVPLPDNVTHEINAWFAECHHLELEPALVIRCPSPEIAARIRAAAPRHIEAATETLLLLSDPSKRSQVINACRKAGLFLEGGEPVKPAKAKRKRRQSSWRRYW